MGKQSRGGKTGRRLGLLSAGLGAPALLAPDAVLHAIGVRPTGSSRAVLRAVAAQELTVATGLLRGRHPAWWQWLRVAGDVTHLALLPRAHPSTASDRRRITRTAVAVTGFGVLDVLAAVRLSRWGATTAAATEEQLVEERRALTIRRPPEEVYRYWRDFENLPSFLTHVRSVESADGGTRSHWTANAPLGRAVEWDAEIVEDVPGEVISWRSLPGAAVRNRGTVRFASAPRDQGTEMHVELSFDPPAGRAGTTLAKLFGEAPEQQIADDLRRFKQILETGEVVRSDGSPEGSSTQRLLKQHPAQPPTEGGVTER